MTLVLKKPVKALGRLIMGMVDRFLGSFQEVRPSLKWAELFNGGFKPVAPVQDIVLTVKSGKMPSDVSGAFMRVGPNITFWPPTKRTHVFDGDGMVHVVRIKGNAATYHCDYLETPRFLFEKKYGKEWFTRIGEFSGWPGLFKILTVVPSKGSLGCLDAKYEGTTANTAIGYTPEGKLWALNEAGVPFRFYLDKNGVPKSLGLDTLQGALKDNISAHPKFDQRTGETFFHSRELMKTFKVGRIFEGKLTHLVDIKSQMGGDGFHHDMFITENFVVIIDGSTRFGPKGVVKKKPLWTFEPEVKLRFGIYRRGSGEMTSDAFTWVEADEAAEIVHTMYAYDEGDKITLWAPVGYYEPGKDEGILGDLSQAKMKRFEIDTTQRKVKIENVSGGDKYSTEFPRTRDDRMGKRVSSGYSGLQEEGNEFGFIGILKWNFEAAGGGLDGVIHLPEGVIGGEPIFVPGSGGASSSDDTGYIAMFLWNKNTEESTFALFDAKTFSSTPVVELTVPRRVPLGFHAAWITEEQFQKQLM
eukprot:TRINITY_DN6185_c1_g1_i6.p1 TRINITY_DN6185_c1_g1~~TRINITY_DN6185_c1_g1_i6.p1  ORF type:complete len:552 (+),score=95.89 TRINITY_DN6185_c1_g1_i6:75-1658(+)